MVNRAVCNGVQQSSINNIKYLGAQFVTYHYWGGLIPLNVYGSPFTSMGFLKLFKTFFLYYIDFLFYIMQQNMDPKKFHEIDEDLTSSDVALLKFLCMDLIPKKRLETVIDAKDLFLRLDEQTLLDDGLLVPELLITIGRLDLLVILGTTKEEVERELLERNDSSKGVSAYRYEGNS